MPFFKAVSFTNLIIIAAVLIAFCVVSDAHAAENLDSDAIEHVSQSSIPWWGWVTILFFVSIILGVLAVLSGVGGAVLFVPIVSGFFPFHLDLVRGAGLFLALSGSLSAGPTLLKKGMASLKLALPIAIITSLSAIIGALVGLSLPTKVVQFSLGAIILGILAVMLLAKRADFPVVKKQDPLAAALGICGVYHEHSTSEHIDWTVHRTLPALFVFVFVGFAAGMFGLGAGWANVPILNLMMGAPLKVAVATSNFLLSITGPSAAWIYLNKGAVLPIIVVPSMIGIMIGARIGAKMLGKTRPASIRYIVLVMLFFAGVRSIMKAFSL